MEELKVELESLKKRVHRLESENGKMAQDLTNLKAEIFLEEVNAMFPDNVIFIYEPVHLF